MWDQGQDTSNCFRLKLKTGPWRMTVCPGRWWPLSDLPGDLQGTGPHSQAPSACLHGHQILWVRVQAWACAWVELDMSDLFQCLPEQGAIPFCSCLFLIEGPSRRVLKRLFKQHTCRARGWRGNLVLCENQGCTDTQFRETRSGQSFSGSWAGAAFPRLPALPCQHLLRS